MKYYLFLFLDCLFIQSISAQDNYHPLVEEGKRWKYYNFYQTRPEEYNYLFYHELKGDTVVTGKKCLKLYVTNRLARKETWYDGALYEEGKRVFYYKPESETAVLLYDFSCKEGDTVTVCNQQLTVKSIRNIEEDQQTMYKKYELQPIGSGISDFTETWVEGVGSTTELLLSTPSTGDVGQLYSCEIGSMVLYSAPDVLTSLQIEGHRMPTSSPQLFDLQGRRLTSKPAKGVYIQQGKKIVVGCRT